MDLKNDDKYFLVEEIVDRRKVKGKYEYLIKWKGFTDEYTWEPIENLENIKQDIEEYDEMYESANMENKKSKNKKHLINNNKRKCIKEKSNKESEISSNCETDGYTMHYFLVDYSIEKTINVLKEGNNLIAEVTKKNNNGDIIHEKINTKDLKKMNPWVLINFYESKIIFEKNKE